MKHCILITLLGASALSSCKKEPAEIKDCEKNNYGIVKINFSSGTYKHRIVITYPNLAPREKMVIKGQLSDTVHLAPEATAYPISISSINDLGTAIDQTSKSATVNKCSEETFDIPF